MEGKWQKEWPTVPGCYWFYGWDFGDTERFGEAQPAKVYFVKVRRAMDGNVYVCEGNFIYKSQALGVWWTEPIPFPEIPKYSAMDIKAWTNKTQTNT